MEEETKEEKSLLEEKEEKLKQSFLKTYGKNPTPNELQQYKDNNYQVSWSKK